MSRMLKIMGLAIVVVSAFAGLASAAQAAVPSWTIEGTEFTGTETVEVEKTTEAPTLSVPGLLNLKGTEVKTEGAQIFGANKDSANHIVFTGVKVESNEENCQATSTIHTGTTEAGALEETAVETIKTDPVKTELKTVGGKAYDFFSPTFANGVFVNVMISAKPTKSCPVSGNYKVTGTVAGLVPQKEDGVTQSLTFSEAIQKAAEAKLLFGAKESFLSGKADLILTGLNKGKSWGVNP